MPSTASLNRRQWLLRSGASLAGLALSSRLLHPDLCAQTVSPERLAATVPMKARLSLNENPLGPAPAAVQAMQAALADGRVSRYPYHELAELGRLIAAKEGVSEDQLVFSAGSGELLETLGAVFGGAGKEIVYAEPGYLQLVAAARALGGVPVPVPVDAHLRHDLAAMASRIGPRTGLVYLANPNNPTGTLLPTAELKAFVKAASAKALVVIDEAYLDISDDYAARTAVDLVREGHQAIVLRTFSKIYGMAGLRVGYGIASPRLAAQLRNQALGPLGTLGVVAAVASLKDARYVPETRAKIVAERDRLVALLRELRLEFAEPAGNFVFFKTGRPYQEVADRCRAESVGIARPFPPYTEWVRISVGLPEENTHARATLRQVLA